MDNDIKRLLKLEQIKGFKLLDSEKKKLAEWKAAQKRVTPVPPRKVKAPKDHTIMEMGTEAGPTIVPNKEIGEKVDEKIEKKIDNKVEKITNVVQPEEKVTGEL